MAAEPEFRLEDNQTVQMREDSQQSGKTLRPDQPVSRILTVDKLLLLLGGDADQVGVELLAALLGLGPGVSLCEMEVAAALELQPALRTPLHNYTDRHERLDQSPSGLCPQTQRLQWQATVGKTHPPQAPVPPQPQEFVRTPTVL